MTNDTEALLKILEGSETQVATEWLAEAAAAAGKQADALRRVMQDDATELLAALRTALGAGARPDAFQDAAWAPVRNVLEALSRSRAAQGQSAGDTSIFVLAFKKPLFSQLQKALEKKPAELVAALWQVSALVDRMAAWTVSTYQQTREEIIKRQQEELLELSTPVIKLWEGVLAVPMIGTLDSQRTQMVMEALLERIVATGSNLAIIDITGVPTVDTLVAQHLLKTVSAIRLMGAECIISGIRPQIAQTIVHLGIDLQGIASKSSLADALAMALAQQGYRITREA